MNRKSVWLLATVVALGGAATARADFDFQSLYDEAFGEFKLRGEDPDHAVKCAERAEAALDLAENAVQKYNALVLESRCTYYVGMKRTDRQQRIDTFLRARDLAGKAKALQPNRAEAYYFYAINLGRWAQANGILDSLFERHNLLENANAVLTRKAFDDDGKEMPGKQYDGFGAYRTLGRFYFECPDVWPLEGDKKKSEQLLRDAITGTDKLKDPNGKNPMQYPNALNVVYLAETLIANGKQDEAKKILKDLLAFEKNPEAYNPNRVPETRDEMETARQKLKELE